MRKTLRYNVIALTILNAAFSIPAHSQNHLLPLHQFELKASLRGNAVRLNWVAENEVSSTRFVVERSKDGVSFSSIGTEPVEGSPNSPTNYGFPDDISAIATVGHIYYRIRVENLDGRYGYSNIAIIKLNNTSEIQVWPCPFDHTINITYNSTSNSTISIILRDAQGRDLSQFNQTVSYGFNQVTITNLNRLSTGTYFIRIADQSGLLCYTQKLVR